MTWIKIDDSFPDHPKIIGLSDKAFRAHIQGLCYCGRFLTDGFIPLVAVKRLADDEAVQELFAASLWLHHSDGIIIDNYLEHQTSKEEVEHKRELSRKRSERYRSNKSQNQSDDDDWGDAESNALVTYPEDRIQNTDNRIQNTEITTSDVKPVESSSEYLPTLPRVASAREAVEAVSRRLDEARRNGINAWNLSRLIEDEWDKLHSANDIGGCIALTAWYVSELQSRNLSSAEIGRIGQMTKRFGRIALLAIDEAASKNLDDLVSYAFRIAQNEYAKRKG